MNTNIGNFQACITVIEISDVYLELSKDGAFCGNKSGFLPLTIFAKISILDV